MSDRIITVDQLIKELHNYNHKELHVHHTWRPNHSNFNGKNHLQLQANMRNFHVNTNKWDDIAQHVTLTPDGLFVTGRSFGSTPASIKGFNTGGFCMEMIGDFDKGRDTFGGKQKESALKLAKFFDDRKKYIRFHRENAPKTCPGTSIDKNQFLREMRGLTVSSSVPSTPYTGLIRKGDHGPHVEELQFRLNNLGYSLYLDGEFGPSTDAAVRAFQKKNGLSVDGIVGDQTRKALNDAGKGKYRVYTGKFGSHVFAEKAQENIKKTFGWNPFISDLRVFTGIFSDIYVAQQAADKIKATYGLNPRVREEL